MHPAPPRLLTNPQSYIEGLGMGVMKLGTERIRQVLAALGNPQNQVPVVHVVGTNGKGSTCAMLEAIYRAAGYRTGLFISPHLVNMAERIQINGTPLAKTPFSVAANAVFEASRQVLGPDNPLTYFEFINAMAFWQFAQSPVDLAIVETGLGGRLDSTNTVDQPALVLLTPIALDHMDRLGPTLTHIAREKAGAFKADVPVISAFQPEVVREVLENQRQNTPGPLEILSPRSPHVGPLETDGLQAWRQVTLPDYPKPFQVHLLGRYQAENLQLVLAGVHQLQERFRVPQAALYEGVRQARWPGRFQYSPQHQLVVDGSHNAQGIESLVETLRQDFPDTPLILGLSLLANRDSTLLEPLLTLPNVQEVHVLGVTPVERFYAPQRWAADLAHRHPALPCVMGTLPEAFCEQSAPQGSLKILTGSLYTAGRVLGKLF